MKELIGERIRERRKELNLSQERLSAKSGVCRTVISNLENGKCNDILVSTLSSIAVALDTTVEFFFA